MRSLQVRSGSLIVWLSPTAMDDGTPLSVMVGLTEVGVGVAVGVRVAVGVGV